MPRKRFTEEQIAFALRQHESGAQIAEIIRKLGVTEQTFYRWKKKFAGLGVAELRRLRQLEEENICVVPLATSIEGGMRAGGTAAARTPASIQAMVCASSEVGTIA